MDLFMSFSTSFPTIVHTRRNTRVLQLLALALCMSVLNACSVYKPDIAQGNIVSAEQVAALKVGMSRQQVQQTLGSPLLQDVFNTQRWDYVYRYLKGNGSLEQRVMTVLFDADGKLASWSGASAPEQKDISFKPLMPAAALVDQKTLTAEPIAKLGADVLAFNTNQSITPPVEVDSPAASTDTPAMPVAVVAAPAPAAATTVQATPNVAHTATQTTPTVLRSPDINTVIGQAINAWKAAWISKNVNAYAAHYEADYKGDLPNHAAWLAQRKRVFDASGDISITLSDIKVIQTSNTEARASFTQAYQSARLTETGIKQLFFLRTGDTWRIATERFLK
jgi:outer membrane protein assembly factor BamE